MIEQLRNPRTKISKIEEIRYGFGPGGVAIIVEGLTDNRNRTASNVRTSFNKYGGALGETGSVSHLFKRYGFIKYDKSVCNEDDFFNSAIEAGAEDCFLKKLAMKHYVCQMNYHLFIQIEKI